MRRLGTFVPGSKVSLLPNRLVGTGTLADFINDFDIRVILVVRLSQFSIAYFYYCPLYILFTNQKAKAPKHGERGKSVILCQARHMGASRVQTH
jgi:hypothetical protein